MLTTPLVKKVCIYLCKSIFEVIGYEDKTKNQQIEMHLITIEDLVPDNHLLRKVSDIIDFSFI